MEKTYRAIRHDVTRNKQKIGSPEVHHPKEKEKQLEFLYHDLLFQAKNGLELFAGEGNCTKIHILNCDKLRVYELNKVKFSALAPLNNGCFYNQNSFREYHRLIADGAKFDMIDLDPYGFPTRLLPDIFLLMDDGYMFITMPKPFVNILNGITATHLISYFGEQNPSSETIVNKIALQGLCHWRKVELISEYDLKSVWRYLFKVTKVKATDYTGVRNR